MPTLASKIDDELRTNPHVTKLYLGGNQLSGTIPSSLSNLTNLTILWLDNNQLSGCIPESLSNLTNLATLDLSDNQLSRNIPSSLGNLTNLTRLHLYNNQLSGNIPVSLGNLTNLTQLTLHHNQLSGNIPSSLGNLTNLGWLCLQNNQLSGNIPSSLGNLTNLTHLYLENNQLSGSIPRKWIQSKKLNTVNISNNYFQKLGGIPSGWKVSNAFQQQTIQILEKNEGEITARKKALNKLGVPSRVIDYFIQRTGKLPQNEKAVEEMFERGDIPLGFDDNLLWSKTAHILNNLSKKLRNDRSALQSLTNKEMEAKKRLEELDKARGQIVDEIASYQSQKMEIENTLESIQHILTSDYGATAQNLAQAEEQLAIATRKQFENDVNDFAAIDDDDTSNPKLSLVFNTFGMSKEVIMKVTHLDGSEFRYCTVESLCKQVGVTTFGQVKQLMYVQNMMKNGVYLSGKHQEECPVCNATNLQDFKYLIEEHAVDNEDIKKVNVDRLMELEINGPAFLALTTQDLSTQLKISDKNMRRSFLKAKRYFEAIHQDHLAQ